MRPSILFYPNELRTDKRTGKVPIYMRIILDRKKTEMRLAVEIKPEDFKQWDITRMRLKGGGSWVNSILNKIENKFDDFLYQNALALSSFTVNDIKSYIMGFEKKPKLKVLAFINNYYNKSVENNTGITEGTKRNYRKAINHLKKFLKYRDLNDPNFDEINISFALDFNDYLLTSIPSLEKIGLKEPSAFDIVKKFRTIFERALDEQLISVNPFKKIKLKSQSPKRGWLDISQIKKIANLDIGNYQMLCIYRDLFLFQIFTGLSYSDMQSLTHSNLLERDNRNIKLLKRRTKLTLLPRCFYLNR